MKKTMIALMSLFMLVACNEDVYQEADKMSETGNVENGYGGMTTYTYDNNLPGGNIYESPYDLSAPQPIYVSMFSYGTDIDIEFTPYFINGYWDGADDGVLNYGAGTYIPLGTPINLMPNVFNTGSEYDNIIKADPIFVSANSSFDCLDNSQIGFVIDFGPNGYFEFNKTGLSSLEKDLVRHYGKLYGFGYIAYDSATSTQISSGLILSNFYTNASVSGVFSTTLPNWVAMPPFTQLFGPSEQIYHINSSEIMIAHNGGNTDEFPITNPVSGNTYTFKFYSDQYGLKAGIQ